MHINNQLKWESKQKAFEMIKSKITWKKKTRTLLDVVRNKNKNFCNNTIDYIKLPNTPKRASISFLNKYLNTKSCRH